MSNYVYLIIFFVGCFLFIGTNEYLLSEVYLKKLYETVSLASWMVQILAYSGFAGLLLGLLAIMKAYYLAQDTLYLIFPEHLIRLYKGLCEQDVKYCHIG